MSDGERICETGLWCGFTVVERDLGELVRCKDCANGTLSHQRGVPVVECHVMRSYNRPDGYCHLGERKEIANER